MKVMPIFYDVTPSEVRNQTGYYGKDFESHERLYDEETIANWKRALREIGGLKGWEIQCDAWSAEGELVKEITNAILHELKKAHLIVTNYLVGLEHHVEEVLETLNAETNDVKIVAIHGMGGIGKTTLGKVIYNHLLPRFESHCFLADIRETVRSKGMEFLQDKLISNILNVISIDFSNADERTRFIHQRCCNKKVLLLLDDVDDIFQLRALIVRRDQFGYGSRIIITTRNKGIFDHFEVDRCYELSGLDIHHALRLFSQHAFRNEKPLEEYAVLCRKILEIAGGLPLALEVFGSLLRGKSKDRWVSIVKMLEKVPRKEVSAKLRISLEALDAQQKKIFLDIACFFIGQNINIVIHFWDESEFPEEAVEVLQQMSLIKIKEDHSLWMHDQLRDLGRDIVREEHEEPERRSRLWNKEEATKVLTQKRELDKIEAMRIDFGADSEDFSFTSDQFKNLSKLRFLGLDNANVDGDFRELLPNIRWLQWHYCPVQLRSTSLYLKKLVILDLSGSDITDDWNGWIPMQTAVELKVLILRFCLKLTETPDFSRFPLLQRLSLENCIRLDCVHPSIGTLKNLTCLSLKNCSRLETLPQGLSSLKNLIELYIDGTCVQEIPTMENLKSLTILSARECKSLTVPTSIGQLTSLLKLFLDGSGVKELPDSIGNLVKLQYLSMNRCKSLEKVSDSIGQLESLKELHLSWTSICKLPDSVGQLKRLEVLKVIASSITCLPSSLGMSERLEVVNFSSCKDLNGKIFPDNIPFSLRALILDGTNITELSASLSRLPRLQTLDLTGCCKLCTLPDLPSSLRIFSVTCKQLVILPSLSSLVNLEELHLIRCEKLVELPRDIWKLSKLNRLSIDRLKISALPKEIGILSKLKELAIKDCVELKHIPELPRSLCRLEVKRLTAQIFPDLSDSKDLLELKLSYCNKLERIPGLGRLINLRMLSVTDCNELKELDDVDKLESLRDLHISQCESLEKLPDLSMLKELRCWVTQRCGSLQALPDLSKLKLLRYLNLSRCEKLYILEGLEELVSLECLDISECKEIEDLPNLSKLQKLIDLNVEGCEKLVVIEGLEEIESQVSVYMYGCTSLQIIPNLPKIKIQQEKRRYPRPLNIPDISADMIQFLHF